MSKGAEGRTAAVVQKPPTPAWLWQGAVLMVMAYISVRARLREGGG